ncbi:hypothetical protein [Bradyrhizobium sp. LB11.1]|uniref:hypothetical protein n=1 Tax=Bradyrhizobium sp. LB11.1 TaxID=3156326 RepID=UPI003395BC22
MLAANDNTRTSEAHRAIMAEQRQHQPKGEPETVKAWPSGTRYMKAGRFKYIRALNDWNELNGEPQLTVANDNIAAENMDEYAEGASMNSDNLMAAASAKGVLARQAAGKEWKPDDERMDQPHRNEEPPPPSRVYMWRRNGVVQRSDVHGAEDEANRRIDCQRLRKTLGPVCCLLLDKAAGDYTLEQIGKFIRRDRKATATYADRAVLTFLQVAA